MLKSCLNGNGLFFGVLFVLISGLFGCQKSEKSSPAAPTDLWRLQPPEWSSAPGMARTTFQEGAKNVQRPETVLYFPSLKKDIPKVGPIRMTVHTQCDQATSEVSFENREHIALVELIPLAQWVGLEKNLGGATCSFTFRAQNRFGSIHKFEIAQVNIADLEKAFGAPLVESPLELSPTTPLASGALAEWPMAKGLKTISLYCSGGLAVKEAGNLKQLMTLATEQSQWLKTQSKNEGSRLCRLMDSNGATPRFSAIFRLYLEELALPLETKIFDLFHRSIEGPSHRHLLVKALMVSTRNIYAHPIQILIQTDRKPIFSGQVFTKASDAEPATGLAYFSTGGLRWTPHRPPNSRTGDQSVFVLQPGEELKLIGHLYKDCLEFGTADGLSIRLTQDAPWIVKAGSQNTTQTLFPRSWWYRDIWIPGFRGASPHSTMPNDPVLPPSSPGVFCG